MSRRPQLLLPGLVTVFAVALVAPTAMAVTQWRRATDLESDRDDRRQVTMVTTLGRPT